MAGVIGATTGKFVMMAATLVLQGRIDNARTGIAIAPGVAISSIGPALAARIRQGSKVKIGIRSEYVYATIDREQFGMDAGKAYGFSMAVDLRIQVEAIAAK